jgi:hypothetical protein
MKTGRELPRWQLVLIYSLLLVATAFTAFGSALDSLIVWGVLGLVCIGMLVQELHERRRRH